MGSENGSGAAALAAGAESSLSEPALHKDETTINSGDGKTESESIIDEAYDAEDAFVNAANGKVGSGWLSASSPEQNGSVWTSADGAPITFPPTVASQPWRVTRQQAVYLVRIPRSVDENLRNEIRLAEAKLEQTIKKRDSYKDMLQAKKNIKMDLLEKLKPIREKERACREALQGKRMELEPFSVALNKFRNAQNKGQDICSSEEELNDKIAEIQFRIQHESIPLKEEKQLLREIKQLESTRSQVCANSLLQAELMENLGPREEIQGQAKFLRQDLEMIRKEHRQARSEYDSIDKELYKLNEVIEELRQQFEKANGAQQEAYAALRELKRQEILKNDPFYQNKRDVQVVRERAAQKKVKEVEEISTKQVEDFMTLWNTDSKFRADYIKSNERSTVRRLETLDGRSLGPSEKSPTLSNDALPLKSQDAKPLADVSTSGDLKAGKLSTLGAELTNGSQVIESKQEKPLVISPRDDEAGHTENRDKDTKSRQSDLSGDGIASLDLSEQKEKLRQEQIAKAKDAEERKRKRSDKLAFKALARAQKDAERKEKEREKKAQKKATPCASSTDTNLELTGGSELQEQKPSAGAEPLVVTTSKEASRSTTNLPRKDQKRNATQRKLTARDGKLSKPKLGKKSFKKGTWPAPLWAIVSISALVLLVALILFMKL